MTWRRATRLGATLACIALLHVPSAATFDPARTFLMTAFHLSSGEIGRLDQGDVVSRTLDATNDRELATLGIVRIKTSPSKYIERFTDITTFKRTTDVLQIGMFSGVPQAADVAALVIDDDDLKQLRACHVADCKVRLSAKGIERVRQQVDWHATDASTKASMLVRQMLVDYVAGYHQRGTAAAMEYADRVPRLHVGREFASLIDGDPITLHYAPRLRRHLLDYPDSSEKGVTDFVYWSKELVRGRPVISITHVATAVAVDDSPIAYAVGSKQIYAMHYYDASLGLTLLIPDPTAAATYVVYLNRSRIDLFDGLFGGVARRIVAGRARSLVAAQLQRLQRVLASDQWLDTKSRAR
jgi:hypothetical protein